MTWSDSLAAKLRLANDGRVFLYRTAAAVKGRAVGSYDIPYPISVLYRSMRGSDNLTGSCPAFRPGDNQGKPEAEGFSPLACFAELLNRLPERTSE